MKTVDDFRMKVNLNNTEVKEVNNEIKVNMSVDFDRNGDLISYKHFRNEIIKLILRLNSEMNIKDRVDEKITEEARRALTDEQFENYTKFIIDECWDTIRSKKMVVDCLKNIFNIKDVELK